MHADKAREFFSAYLEGKLDDGLRQSFEQRLASDAALKAEFERFAVALSALDTLKVEVPEPDFDLHDKIMARIDMARLENKRKPAWLSFNWRTAVAASVALLVIVSASLTLWGGRGAPMASVTGGSQPSDRLSVRATENGAIVSFQTGGKKAIVLRSVEKGRELVRANLDGTTRPLGQHFRSPIQVKTSSATLIQVDIQGNASPTFVAIPGTRPGTVFKGQGTLQELSLAIAERYHVPVVISDTGSKDHFAWDLTDTDSVAATMKALSDTTLAVEMRPSGVLWIQ